MHRIVYLGLPPPPYPPCFFHPQDIMVSNDLDRNGFLSFDEFLLAMPGNSQISEDDHR